MNRIRITSMTYLWIGLTSLLLPLPHLLGQTDLPGTDRQASSLDVPVDVDFKGGTALDYLRAVQDASGARNIVALDGVDQFAMPPVTLKGVSLESAVGVLDEIGFNESDRAGDLDVIFRGDAIVVRAEFAGRRHEPEETSVWGVAELIGEHLSAEDLLTSVEVALETTNREATVRYHRETGLLLLRGSPPQVHLVSQVIDRLDEASRRNRQHDERERQRSIQSKELDELRNEVGIRNLELKSTMNELDAARRTIDQLQSQLQRAEQRSTELQHQLVAQERDLWGRLTQLEVRLKAAEEQAARYREAFITLEQLRAREDGRGFSGNPD